MSTRDRPGKDKRVTVGEPQQMENISHALSDNPLHRILFITYFFHNHINFQYLMSVLNEIFSKGMFIIERCLSPRVDA